MKKIIDSLLTNIEKHKTLVVALSAVVVFVTTYMLILPALTLDKEEAANQGGIDVVATQSAESTTGAQGDGVSAEDRDTGSATDNDKGNQSDSKSEDVKESVTSGTLTFDTDDYKVAVDFDKKAKLPAGTELEAVELSEDDEDFDYDTYVEKAFEAVRGQLGEDKVSGLQMTKLYDITLMSDGKEIEPSDSVDVTIDYDKKPEIKEEGVAQIVHFTEDKKGKLTAALVDEEDVDVMVKKDELQQVKFTADAFSIYAVIYTLEYEFDGGALTGSGNKYKITVKYDDSAEIPDGTKLKVSEIGDTSKDYDKYLEETEKLVGYESGSLSYARFFDISILDKDGKEVQPADGAYVSVDVSLDDANKDAELQVVHFGEKSEVLDAETKGNTVSFETSGFSVYAIVDAPSTPFEGAGWHNVKNVSDISESGEKGLYLSHNGYFITNVLATGVSGNADRDGLKGTASQFNTTNADTNVENAINAGAVKYYFEVTEADESIGEAYIYTIVGGEKKYVKMTTVAGNAARSGLTLVSDESEGTLFTIEKAGNNDYFYIYATVGNNAHYWNRNTKTEGFGSFIGYNDKRDGNVALVRMWYYTEDQVNPYGLEGKGLGIAYNDESVTATAITAEGKTVNNTQRLTGKDMLIRPDVLDNEGVLLVAENSEITEWNFIRVDDGKNNYYITTEVDGAIKYLTIKGANVTLEDVRSADSIITMTPGTGANEGKWNLSSGGYSLKYSGNAANGFLGARESNVWLNLVEKSDFTEDKFTTYTARKVSVSDEEKVYDESQIIIYTRVWNETRKRYEFFAIDHDGSLIKCYDGGDTIEWIGSNINTALWEFTEYTYNDGTPNGYYELENVTYKDADGADKYIAPQVTGNQILSGNTIGVNLNGRRNGADYTTIIAWDDKQYAYAGLKVENGKVVSCPLSEADDFYFAVIVDREKESSEESSELTTVSTIDSDAYGISMKMIDFNYPLTSSNPSNWRDKVQNAFFKGDNNNPGLLSTNIDDKTGYPKTTLKTGKEQGLEELFKDTPESPFIPVNHLFIESIYNESGYFEYDSTQNFAHLNKDGTFTVYDQIAAVGTESGETRTHGQFLPYNEIDENNIWPYGTNTTDVTGKELPDTNPRKGEKLYNITNEVVDYFFGMEMEASFTQTASGLDAWGHDIIFEFSGDDDFWLYVDGELILDLGGVDKAKTGTINFRTGEVTRSRGGNTTIYDLFKENYKTRGMSDEEINAKLSEIFVKNADGNYVFKDYTNHTMKMYYMERGAGASNLHMRFNLAAVKPGTFLLSKELSGTDIEDNNLMEFPYQVFYTLKDDDTKHLLGEKVIDSSTGRDVQVDSVVYNGTNTPVKRMSSFVPSGETAAEAARYESVFFLTPGESVEVRLPENVDKYWVKECAVNPYIYNEVTVNASEDNPNGEVLTNEETIYQVSDGDGKNKPRIDYMTTGESLDNRKKVDFVNNVDPEAIRTLSITKKLYDQSGIHPLSYKENSTEFSFRLYLGHENIADEGEIPLANMYPYYVKDGDGNYCRWNADEQKFESLGIKEYDALLAFFKDNNWTSADKETVIFRTSMNGSISRIPADHTVEVRNIAIGTQFKVEERDYEIPKGYTLRLSDGYQRIDEGHERNTQDTPISDTVHKGEDPEILVSNQKGWGLTVDKVWTDDDFMESHDDIYFAVYVKKTTENEDGSTTESYELLKDSVRRLASPETEIYYFFGNLQSDIPFENYVVREVTVAPLDGVLKVDDAGAVTVEIESADQAGVTTAVPVAEVKPIEDPDNMTLTIGGEVKGGGRDDNITYNVNYEVGEQTAQNENVRTDTVTNSRPGIELFKTDWEGNPLEGAKFTIKDKNGNPVGLSEYTSDGDGKITVAYLNEGLYTIKETAAPKGYASMNQDVTIGVDEEYNVDVTGSEEFITVKHDNASMAATVTIKNKESSLRMIKKKAPNGDVSEVEEGAEETADVIPNVHFRIYRQVVDNSGEPVKDNNPVPGYGDIVTDENGVLPDVTMNLGAGTYYLEETSAADGYEKLDHDICFTIGADGRVTISDPDYVGWLSTTDESGRIAFTLTVWNGELNKVSFKKVDIGNTATLLKGARFDLYRAVESGGTDDEPGLLYENLISGEDGVLQYTDGDGTEHRVFELEKGDYLLIEREAPAGYIIKTESVKIHVTASGVTYDEDTTLSADGSGKTVDDKTGIVTLAISNSAGVELPNSGGSGTHWIYMLGALLFLTGGVLLIARRRMRA